MNIRLEMTFLNAEGSRVRISVPNGDDTLMATDIQQVMNQLIALDVFAPNGVALTAAESARMITTSVVPYEFA